MKLAIHQPAYWPWRGFLEKWRRADLLVVLDTVPYTRSNWQNRCRIPTPHGDQWLTVPVHGPGLLKDILIDGDRWRAKHARTLDWAMPRLSQRARDIYAQPWDRLADLDLATMRALEPDRPLALASRAFDEMPTERTARLVAICQHFGATTYLHGAGANAYMRPELFHDAGIALEAVVGVWPPYTALAT